MYGRVCPETCVCFPAAYLPEVNPTLHWGLLWQQYLEIISDNLDSGGRTLWPSDFFTSQGQLCWLSRTWAISNEWLTSYCVLAGNWTLAGWRKCWVQSAVNAVTAKLWHFPSRLETQDANWCKLDANWLRSLLINDHARKKSVEQQNYQWSLQSDVPSCNYITSATTKLWIIGLKSSEIHNHSWKTLLLVGRCKSVSSPQALMDTQTWRLTSTEAPGREELYSPYCTMVALCKLSWISEFFIILAFSLADKRADMFLNDIYDSHCPWDSGIWSCNCSYMHFR